MNALSPLCEIHILLCMSIPSFTYLSLVPTSYPFLPLITVLCLHELMMSARSELGWKRR